MKLSDETVATGTMPVLLNYGGAAKAITEMNEEEIEAAGVSVVLRAKEKAFSKGLPICYILDDVIVREYADGKILPVEK